MFLIDILRHITFIKSSARISLSIELDNSKTQHIVCLYYEGMEAHVDLNNPDYLKHSELIENIMSLLHT